jgi:hypothetical protein
MSSAPEFRPFVSGRSFKNGKLYVFSKKDVIVLKPWPDLRAWRRTKRKHWHCIRPCLRLNDFEIEIEFREPRRGYGIDWDFPEAAPPAVVPNVPETWDTPEFHRIAEEWKLAPQLVANEPPAESGGYSERLKRRLEHTERFLVSIPDPIRKLVGSFSNHHWHLLSMLARCPRSGDLLVSNPALGFAMSHAWIYAGHKSSHAHEWVRRHLPKPQKTICGLLGFPANESSVRILRKLEPHHCGAACLFDLRRLMADERMVDHLRHLPKLTPGVIRFLSLIRSKGWQVSRPLVRDWFFFLQREGDHIRRNDTYLMMEDTLKMLPEDLGRGWTLTYQSIAGMRRAHDAANRRQAVIPVPVVGNGGGEDLGFGTQTDLSRWERYADEHFSSPPVPGNSGIIPLSTGRDILEEAAAMRHCVASYIPQILNDNSYIYRIVKPERATLELTPRWGRDWEMRQLCGPGNRVVGPVTRKLITLWLRAWRARELELQPL